jgi:lipopolysaccharide export system protein LptC
MTLTRSADAEAKVRGIDAKRAAFAQAQTHSRRVRVLKFLLPALAVILAVAFVTYSWIVTPANVSIDLGQSAFSDGKLVMANPKLEGFTKNKQRYVMTANRAAQVLQRPNVFELEGIEATLPVSADNWARVSAAAGIYNRVANTINFTSPVTINTDDGMQATLQAAYIDIEKGALLSKKPVDIALNGMRISANWMWVGKNGKVLIFKDRVRMEIDPGRLKDDQDTSGAPDGG